MFQKRLDGSGSFNRYWDDYKNGFGNLNGEFWLGLDKIYRLTEKKRNYLRIDLEDFSFRTAYAEYDMFAVTNETTKYKLSLGKYSGIVLGMYSGTPPYDHPVITTTFLWPEQKPTHFLILKPR